MLDLIDHIGAVHVEFILEQVEPEADPARQLECFFGAGFAFVEQHPDQTPVIINAVYGPDDEFKQRVYQGYNKLFMLITNDIVGDGIARGEFRPVDPDLTAALLMSIYLGSCSQTDASGKIWLAPDQVAAFILEGLRQRDLPIGRKE